MVAVILAGVDLGTLVVVCESMNLFLMISWRFLKFAKVMSMSKAVGALRRVTGH
jgi:hypothetical protein